MTVKLAAEIWRDYETDGVPASGTHKPLKSEIRHHQGEIEAAIGTFRNLIIGGDFSTNPWQRGTTFTAPTNASYTADRFSVGFVGGGVFDILKTADAPTIAQAGLYTQHCLNWDVTTADASIAAGETYSIQQRIEGLCCGHLGFGQSAPRSITISFWVKSTKTGIFCVAVRNAAANRSYVAEYTVSVSNTWEKKTLTIPGDASGTWLNTNIVGLILDFTLASGSTFQTAAGAWAAGNFNATANQVNAMDSASNNFKLALVQVQAGAAAGDFEIVPADIVLKRCQRYYRKSFDLATAPAQNVGSVLGAAFHFSAVAAATFGTRISFDRMRAVPTVTTYNPSAANANWRDATNSADRTATFSNQSETGFTVTGASGAAAAANFIHWQASAEL